MFLKVLLGVLLLVAVPVVSCVALQGVSKDRDEELVQELNRRQNTHAITNEQARGVTRETTRQEVERRFGPPKTDEGGSSRGLGNDVCIYYNVRGSRSFDKWQFCFAGPAESETLTVKNRFS